jgi:polysaccharide chain length determinant protein (PEP-CTERM system associated)
MLPGRKLTPADILAMAKRRIWFLLIPPVLGLFAGLIVSSRVSDLYRSEMLLQIVPQRVPDSYVRSTVTMDTEDRLESLQAQVKSRTLLEGLITEVNLYPRLQAKLPMEDVVDKMRLDIDIELVRPSRAAPPDAFYVRFTYDDPLVAANVTRRLGGLFIDSNARDRGQLADATSQFMQRQLADSKARLEEQERKLEAFRQRYSGRLPSQLESNMQSIQTLQMQLQAHVESLARDRDRKLLLERLYNDMLQNPPVPPAAIVQGGPTAVPVPISASQQLEIERARLMALEQRFRPDHPDIRRSKATIVDLEVRVKAEAATKASSPGEVAAVTGTPEQQAYQERLAERRAEIESLNRQITFKEGQEVKLRAQVGDYQNRIESIPGIESEWIALSRDYTTLQTNYNTLLTKSEDSKIAANLERQQIGEQFRILDEARVPTRPIGPLRLEINGIATGIGLLIGIGLLALLEIRDTTFRTEAEVLEVLALPVIALVPYVQSTADVAQERRKRRWLSLAAVATAVSGGVVVWALQLWRHLI